MILDIESQILEYKEQLVSYRNLAKTCVAFANGRGGRIIVGVRDQTREVVGVGDIDIRKCFEDLPNSIYDLVQPNLLPQISTKLIGDNYVVVIQIFPGTSKPYFLASEGVGRGVYLRVGTSTRRAGPEYVEQLKRESRGMTFDEELSGIRKDMLSSELLQEFYAGVVSPRRLLADKVIKNSPVNPQDAYVTNAGVLFFTDNPAEHLNETYVICTLFRGTSGRDIIQTIDFSGPIHRISAEILQQLQTWLERNYKLQGPHLKGISLVPEVALREAVINALIHRKYFIPAPIKIALFDNRLEIFSPGSFPGLVSLADLGDGTTFLRNPILASLARRVKLVEKLGSGIKLIFEACDSQNLRKPSFEEIGDNVRVTFYLETEAQDPEWASVLSAIDENGRISIANAIKTLNVSRNTATRKLKRYVEQGKLRHHGAGRGSYYYIYRS